MHELNSEKVVVRPGHLSNHGSRRKCASCGGFDTKDGSTILSGSRPSVIKFILFGWVYLLARPVFVKKELYCNGCGENSRYQSKAFWPCLVILSFLVGVLALAFFEG